MRTKTEVNESQFRATITLLEESREFSSLGELWKAVAEQMGITPSVAMLRAQEWEIPTKTKPGKRGRPKSATHFPSLDMKFFLAPFIESGISIRDGQDGFRDILTSSTKSDAENEQIRSAWKEIRLKLGIPHGGKAA